MTSKFIEGLEEKAVFAQLQKLFGINPKIWKDYTDKGIFIDCNTYGEVLKALFLNLKPSRGSSPELRNQIDQVLMAEKLQKIRLDKAKEQEIWIKLSVARNELIQKTELEQLMFPLFLNMVNILRHAADTTPSLQEPIDKCIEELYSLGERLEEQAIGDREKYVQVMLEAELDYQQLINEFENQHGE